MRKYLISIIWICVVYFPVNSQNVKNQKIPAQIDYIDMHIGTYNDGFNCVIGPQLPFGSINPSPQTPNGEHDGYDPGQPIRGFGQLHVSGTGWGKYGQIFVSPQTGLAVGEEDHDSPKSDEFTYPYEYGVTLTKYNIKTSFIPSYHSAIYKFVFPKSDNANILFDITHNIPMDIAKEIGGKVSEGAVFVDTVNNTIRGYGLYSGGFGNGDYYVFFYAEVNKMPYSYGTFKNGTVFSNEPVKIISADNERVGAYLKFKTKSNDNILLKIAVSFKSTEQAKKWLETEIPEWDYSGLKEKAKEAWIKELSKINVEGGSDTDRKIFYTAMYHSMLMPRNRTGDMSGYSDEEPLWDDHYAVWDTWRTVFPLMSLINPDMVSSNVNSFIARFKKNGRVKDAFIAGIDMAEEQGGNNIDNVISEAWTHDVPGINWDMAYLVLKNNANYEREGFQGFGTFAISDTVMNSFRKKGWIPAGIMSCSKSLEYSYNDYCVSQVAKGLSKAEYQYYLDRSGKWTYLWNPDAESDGYKGFIVPRNNDGSWVNIDLKYNWGSWQKYFYEGSSWTYSYFVPHQFERLVELSGGKEAFADKLNYGFEQNLIDYSNEPAFLAAQAFHYAGRSDLASYWTRKLISTKYSLKGVPGNDDSGAMSSLYIFSSMGFVPNAGQDIYYLTGTLFKKVTIKMGNGKELVITGENASKDNIYIQYCTINDKPWDKPWFRYNDIKNGAVIKFVMTKKIQ